MRVPVFRAPRNRGSGRARTGPVGPAGSWNWGGRGRRSALILSGLLTAVEPGSAQVSITEVLADQSNRPEVRGGDYVEVTNFGTEPVPLASLWFADDSGFGMAQNLGGMTSERFLPAGRSLVLARRRDSLGTAAEFREWWGDSRLRSDLLLVVAPWSFGINATKDTVLLWQATPEGTNLVDWVDVSNQDPGVALTYDPTTGERSQSSRPGLDGAFRAERAEDVGSPGVTTGPVPLRLWRAPRDAEVDTGSPVTLTAVAHGLPRPRYQWRRGGQPIPGATEAAYSLSNVGPEHAGEYTVEIQNGLSRLVSPRARLTVNVTPRCAEIVQAPRDLEAYPGQTATFHVDARGYPPPTFQWRKDGVDLPGATEPDLMIWPASAESAGLYSVRVVNALCAAEAAARLTVALAPRLYISEVMASPSPWSTVPGHGDWWELTNGERFPVNLRGYRFDDQGGSPGTAIVIDRDLILQPGQSMVGVSDMTAEAFRRWWGEENLPEDLEIVPFNGNGFSTDGDAIRLWNAAALERSDFVVSLGFVNDQAGVSLWFDPAASEDGHPSVEGERRAFRAAESDDVGSPGWTGDGPRVIRPRIVGIEGGADEARITWRTLPGRTYAVRATNRWPAESWRTMLTRQAEGKVLTVSVPGDPRQAERYFQVILLP